ncbi:hypothetical protein SD70_13710 [Gordoniibacillus kamchatkensis]|uniref:Uncharacterized protein n=1 Tax=Gordoniibacillus kamchatkensis TaxID=1590651 RepID=A0ABR5AHB9_9BACL|nr:hypothetical protein [Paenibacillus sp. VKM B-2647]KIL40455.1 hypothetical protein SD70_13710 [Paenibacillus sp. VKM B-2647]
MARQFDEREHRETLRRLFGWGLPDDGNDGEPSLRELSFMMFGFDLFKRFTDVRERMDFVVSDEAAELRALVQAQAAKEYEERRERMTPEERRIYDLETELLLLQLEEVNQELDKCGGR